MVNTWKVSGLLLKEYEEGIYLDEKWKHILLRHKHKLKNYMTRSYEFQKMIVSDLKKKIYYVLKNDDLEIVITIQKTTCKRLTDKAILKKIRTGFYILFSNRTFYTYKNVLRFWGNSGFIKIKDYGKISLPIDNIDESNIYLHSDR